MTRDVLITITKQELEKLPADEMAVIATHFRTEDHGEVARKLAVEAEEMWGGDHASVAADKWPNAHLRLVLGFYRDEERECLLDELRSLAFHLGYTWPRSRQTPQRCRQAPDRGRNRRYRK